MDCKKIKEICELINGRGFKPHEWEINGLPIIRIQYHTWNIKEDGSKVDKEFFYNTLEMLTKYIEEKAHGASALVHTQKSEMENFYIPIPKIEEQTAIANILSDMDKEVEKLQLKLNKYKNIKRGMMEELLTGNRRLV